MVSATDLRYATKDAFFCIQEINIGMTADVGTLQRMPKLVPEGVVREMAYTGRNMSANAGWLMLSMASSRNAEINIPRAVSRSIPRLVR